MPMIGSRCMGRRNPGRKLRRNLLSALLVLPALADQAAARAWSNDDHTLEFSSRLRAAHIDETRSHGKAMSALFRLRLTSSWTDRWSTLAEIDHVATAFQNDHSDGLRVNDRPLIPDVPGTEFNQLLLRYELPDMTFAVGRQLIEYDDQRFIGSAGFWQNQQTFDGFTGDFTLLTSSRFNYAYIANANRIFGDRAREHRPPEHSYFSTGEQRPAALLGDHRHNSHLARLELNEWDYSQLIGYSYLIDNRDLPQASNRTLGAKYRFNYQTGAMRYRAELEAAVQEQPEIPGNPHPSYGLIELTAGRGSLEALVRHERLGSSENHGFIAPLGSGYRFQGFTDHFIVTPDAGVADTSVGINWRQKPWRLQTRYHWLKAASGNGRYGDEFNIDITFRPVRAHSVMLRFADFRAASAFEERFPDRQVVYLDYSYNF